jgi:SAM-dependent methyltransferase
MILNKTLEFSDLDETSVRATVLSLKRWLWRWYLRGGSFAQNGRIKRRPYLRQHKMWEYARGLALTGAAEPTRNGNTSMRVLDVGGAGSATALYLGSLGDRVLCLDIDERLCEQANVIARRRRLPVESRVTNLAELTVDPADVGDGFDRVYCFCVIEHVQPPGQAVLARRLGEMLRPGGQMCVTFDYGEQAPTEAPIRGPADVESLMEIVGLPLAGNAKFVDTGSRFMLNRHLPETRYTFGSLFFKRP